MDGSGGSGNLLTEVLHWLWLPLLLGASLALLTSAEWRRGVARHTKFLVGLAALSVVGEVVWRLLAPATAVPLAAWAAALFVLSSALTALDPRRRSQTAASSLDQSPHGAEPLASASADDPFRSGGPEAPEAPLRPSSFERSSFERLSFEQTAAGIAVVDLEGQVLLVNPAWARLHGFRASETLGHHLSLFFKPGQMRREVRPWMEEARESGVRKGQAEHRRKDGTLFAVRRSLALLRDGGGEPAGFVAAVQELEPETHEERPATDAETEQELETLRVLVAGAAHEFNNLLTGILGNASLVSQKLPPSTREEAHEIEVSSRRATELSRLLQAYVGKARLTVASTVLAEIVMELTDVLEEAAKGRATLHYDLSQGRTAVAADPAQIRLLLRHLVANAADAAGEEGGEITVRTGWVELDRDDLDAMVMGERGLPGPYAFVEVADTGHGMDDETRSRMFEPLYTTRPGHRGLGLASVVGIVRGHLGVIGVESTPGAGTRIRVLFPAGAESRPAGEEEHPDRNHASAEPPVADETRGDGTILVVDNEKIIRDLATSVLEVHGFSVLTAAEGGPAVAIFRERRGEILAVLLDLSMPTMDGGEVFEEIRQMDPHARVILMTGHDVAGVQADFEGSGLAGVLQKPFRPEDLVEVLRAVLAS